MNKAKVLIVEDDEFLRKMYHQKFLVEGFDVELASDGQDGIDHMKAFAPTVVLLDITMPHLDGLSALKLIKEDASLKDTPIIMLTNVSTLEKVQEALQLGAQGYLIKSDKTPNEIVAYVKDLLVTEKRM